MFESSMLATNQIAQLNVQNELFDKSQVMTDDKCTTSYSGYPHPSALRFFYAHFKGGSREPNTTPSGNKFRRLYAVVEARHPTMVAHKTKRIGV